MPGVDILEKFFAVIGASFSNRSIVKLPSVVSKRIMSGTVLMSGAVRGAIVNVRALSRGSGFRRIDRRAVSVAAERPARLTDALETGQVTGRRNERKPCTCHQVAHGRGCRRARR